jgi:hypothetical protein
MIKILHGTWRYQFLGNVGAAPGVRAETAFILCGDCNTNRDIPDARHRDKRYDAVWVTGCSSVVLFIADDNGYKTHQIRE